MANDFTAFGSAIYGRIGTAGTANVYYAIAVQGATPPYMIIQRNAASDEYTFGTSGNRIVNATYVVKAVSNRIWPHEAYEVYGPYHTLLQGAQLSATGYTFLRCQRVSSLEFQDDEGYWHVGGVYAAEAHET